MKKKVIYATINEELNGTTYKDKECYLCHAKYPKTVLNIEGHIHHGEHYRCLDTQECNRRQRKNDRKNKANQLTHTDNY
jgi:hypothetical protein